MLKQLFLLKTGPKVVKKWGEYSDFVKIWEDFFGPKTNFIFHENFNKIVIFGRFCIFLSLFSPKIISISRIFTKFT